MLKKITFILTILINLIHSLCIKSQISSFQSGNWTSSSTWVGGVVPSSTDDVIIKPNHIIEISSSRNVKSIEIQTNGELLLSNNPTVNIYPGFITTQYIVINGSISGVGKLKVYGYTYFSGNGTFGNDIKLESPWYTYFDGNSDFTLNALVKVTGGGVIEIKSGSTLRLNGSSRFTVSSKLYNYGTLEIMNDQFCYVDRPSNTVLYNYNGSKVIYSYDGDLKLPVEFSPNIGYPSHFVNLEINSNISSSTNVNIYGNMTVNGVFTQNSTGKIITFSGSGSSNLDGTGTANFNNLNCDKIGGLALSCDTINIFELIYNSNSRIITNSSSNLFLKSTSNSTAGMLKVGSSSEFLGNINVERYFSIDGSATNGGWVNISSSIANTSLATLATSTNIPLCGDFQGANYSYSVCGNFTSLFFYKELNSSGSFENGWLSADSITGGYNSSSNLEYNNAPFIWANPGVNKISISGDPYLENDVFPITKSGSSSTEDGWNLVSNPYPCSIDWNSFVSRNSTLSNTAYAYSPTSGNWNSITTNGHIPHSQSFFVQTSTDDSIRFNLDDLSNEFNASYSRSNNGLNLPLMIKISGNVNLYYDKVYLNALQNFSTNYDHGYDIAKLLSPIPDYAPNIFFLDSNNIKLGTNYISNTHSVSIPIQCNVGNLAQGNYSLTFENSAEFMIGSCLELEDLHTGIITNLRNDTIYNFMSDTNSQSPRFILHIERSFNIDVINPTCSNDSSGKIYISSNEVNGKTFKLFNSSGLVVDSIFGTNDTVLFENLNSGIFSLTYNDSIPCSLQNQNIVLVEPDEVIARFFEFNDTLYVDSTGYLHLQFNNRSVNSTSYLWDFGDNTTSNIKNPLHQFSSGFYTVSLTAYNDTNNLCSSTFHKNLLVLDSLTLNNKLFSNQNFTISVNKISNKLLIFVPKFNLPIKIYDINGKLINILTNGNNKKIIEISLDNFKTGIYLIQIGSETKKFYYETF